MRTELRINLTLDVDAKIDPHDVQDAILRMVDGYDPEVVEVVNSQYLTERVIDLAQDFLDDWAYCNKQGGDSDDVKLHADAAQDFADVKEIILNAWKR